MLFSVAIFPFPSLLFFPSLPGIRFSLFFTFSCHYFSIPLSSFFPLPFLTPDFRIFCHFFPSWHDISPIPVSRHFLPFFLAPDFRILSFFSLPDILFSLCHFFPFLARDFRLSSFSSLFPLLPGTRFSSPFPRTLTTLKVLSIHSRLCVRCQVRLYTFIYCSDQTDEWRPLPSSPPSVPPRREEEEGKRRVWSG